MRHLRGLFSGAGFTTAISTDIAGWLLGHAAFVVPIAFALYRVSVDAGRLATDRATMRLMVGATWEASTVLRQTGNREIPINLRVLYSLPTLFVVAYCDACLPAHGGAVVRGSLPRGPRRDVRRGS